MFWLLLRFALTCALFSCLVVLLVKEVLCYAVFNVITNIYIYIYRRNCVVVETTVLHVGFDCRRRVKVHTVSRCTERMR